MGSHTTSPASDLLGGVQCRCCNNALQISLGQTAQMYITVLYTYYTHTTHTHIYIYKHTCGTPVCTGIMFQDPPRLHETADNTERYT